MRLILTFKPFLQGFPSNMSIINWIISIMCCAMSIQKQTPWFNCRLHWLMNLTYKWHSGYLLFSDTCKKTVMFDLTMPLSPPIVTWYNFPVCMWCVPIKNLSGTGYGLITENTSERQMGRHFPWPDWTLESEPMWDFVWIKCSNQYLPYEKSFWDCQDQVKYICSYILQFEENLIAIYPRTKRCIHGNIVSFLDLRFQDN